MNYYFHHILCLVATPHLQCRKLGKYFSEWMCEWVVKHAVISTNTFSGLSLDYKSIYRGVPAWCNILGVLPKRHHLYCTTCFTQLKVLFDWILPDSSTFSVTTQKCSGLILLHVKHKGR